MLFFIAASNFCCTAIKYIWSLMTGPARRTLVTIFYSSGTSPDLADVTDCGEGGLVLKFTLKCLLRSFNILNTGPAKRTFSANFVSSGYCPPSDDSTDNGEGGVLLKFIQNCFLLSLVILKTCWSN